MTQRTLYPATILGFLFLLLITYQSTNAQNIWIVSNEPGYTPADFDNIQSAIDSASQGDLIYIHGTASVYSENPILDKKLHIIGPGYWTTLNGIDQLNTNSANTGTINIGPGSDSTIIEGIVCTGMDLDADHVIIRYNRIERVSYALSLLNVPENIAVYANYIVGCMSGSGINVNAFNNIFINDQFSCSSFWHQSGSNSDCLFQNNSCYGAPSFNNGITDCIARNNIFRASNFSISNCPVYEHNLFTDNAVTVNGIEMDSLGFGNIDSVDIADVWDFAFPSPDGDFLLIGDTLTNPAIGAGVDGVDCGAFGGASPYHLSGIVDIPTITYMLVPPIGDTTNMLNVTIKAKSN